MRGNLPEKRPYNDYIRTIEAQESIRKRRKRAVFSLLILIALVSLCSLWLFIFYAKPGSKDLEKVDLREMNEELIKSKLADHPQGFIIEDKVIGLSDTIFEVADFWEMKVLHDELTKIREIPVDTLDVVVKDTSMEDNIVANSFQTNTSETDSRELNTEPATQLDEEIPIYTVDIIGDRVVGNSLRFTIADYDPDFLYLIDYGNGEVVKAENTHTYQYKAPDTYHVKLTAINRQSGSKSAYVTQIEVAETPEALSDMNLEEKNRVPEIVSISPQKSSEKIQLTGNTLADSETDLEITRSSDENEAEDQDLENVPMPGISESAGTSSVPADVAGPMSFAETMPQFPGGLNALRVFFDSRIDYPQMAREHEVEGKVYLQFVVSATGKLSDFRVVKGIGYGCDEEALRIARLMPNWIPGFHERRHVSVVYTLPVDFILR